MTIGCFAQPVLRAREILRVALPPQFLESTELATHARRSPSSAPLAHVSTAVLACSAARRVPLTAASMRTASAAIVLSNAATSVASFFCSSEAAASEARAADSASSHRPGMPPTPHPVRRPPRPARPSSSGPALPRACDPFRTGPPRRARPPRPSTAVVAASSTHPSGRRRASQDPRRACREEHLPARHEPSSPVQKPRAASLRNRRGTAI